MKDKIELVRNMLYNAADMNAKQDTLLKLSQKLDKYIVKYLQENAYQKGELNEQEAEGKSL